MFVASGVGPFSGQSVHFRNYAPEKIPYAINRYMYEAQRHYTILNERLAKHKYMVGDAYTIVDMAVWGWARLIPVALGEEAWAKFPNLKRLVDEISARPAAARANAMKDKHKFKTEFDDEARKAMFKHHAHQGGLMNAGEQQRANRRPQTAAAHAQGPPGRSGGLGRRCTRCSPTGRAGAIC